MEERPAIDPTFAQGRDQFITRQPIGRGDQHRIHPVDIGIARRFRRQGDAGQIGQHFTVLASDASFALDKLGNAGHLRHTHRRLQVRHPVVEAHLVVPITTLRRHGVITQEATAGGQRGVVRGQHATLASGDNLVGIKTKRADLPQAASALLANGGAVCFCRILHHQQAMCVGDGVDFDHFGRMAVEVHRHNRLCTWRD